MKSDIEIPKILIKKMAGNGFVRICGLEYDVKKYVTEQIVKNVFIDRYKQTKPKGFLCKEYPEDERYYTNKELIIVIKDIFGVNNIDAKEIISFLLHIHNVIFEKKGYSYSLNVGEAIDGYGNRGFCFDLDGPNSYEGGLY